VTEAQKLVRRDVDLVISIRRIAGSEILNQTKNNEEKRK